MIYDMIESYTNRHYVLRGNVDAPAVNCTALHGYACGGRRLVPNLGVTTSYTIDQPTERRVETSVRPLTAGMVLNGIGNAGASLRYCIARSMSVRKFNVQRERFKYLPLLQVIIFSIEYWITTCFPH